MAKLALVTGAAGFIGRYTAQALTEAGWDVVGVGLGFSGVKGEWRRFGIRLWKEAAISLGVLEELSHDTGCPQAIIHCAGSGSVAYSLQKPREDFLNNVNTTLDVLEFARNHHGVRVVVPSSAAVYGSAETLPIKEDSTLHPISPYGTHKILAEELCRSFASNWDIPVSVIRLFSVYGDGLRKQLLWDACCKAQSTNFTFFGSGEEIRDWLHVRDAARLMASATDFASSHCPVLNGGTGKGVSIREILTILGNLWIPRLKPQFSGQVRAGDPTHYIADCTRIRDHGFTPAIDLREGLAHYVNWFKSLRGHR